MELPKLSLTTECSVSGEHSVEKNDSLAIDRDGGMDASYVPVSLSEMSEETREMIFVQSEIDSQLESVSALQQHDYRYAIDKSTGNLLIIQNSTHVSDTSNAATTKENGSSSGLSLSGDALAFLQVLDDGQCVLETSTEQITFHSAEDIQSDDEGDASKLDGGCVLTLKSGSQEHQQAADVPVRRALWSRRKIADFIQCIHNHEQRFRKSSKIRGNIWNDISKDMFELGHHDCNKDECSKKWNNLYRTWKKVKLRPKEDRHKWQYFQQVTTLVKSISQRDGDKSTSKRAMKPSAKELIVQLIELNRKHQENIRMAEEKFQEQTLLLDKDRDAVLHDIRTIFQT